MFGLSYLYPLPDETAALERWWNTNPAINQWRAAYQQAYREDPEFYNPDYNYRKAFEARALPQPVADDFVPHWSSVGKATTHPTYYKELLTVQHPLAPVNVTPEHAFVNYLDR